MPRASQHERLDVPAGASFPGRSLPLELLRARELVMRRYRPLFHARDLTEQQWRVLRVIAAQDRCSMQTLAEACCIHPPSLSRMVPKLLARGLLRRRSDVHDQRRAEISITPEGQALHDVVARGVEGVRAQLEDDLGRERIAGVLACVCELIEALGGTAAFLSGPVEEGSAGDDLA